MGRDRGAELFWSVRLAGLRLADGRLGRPNQEILWRLSQSVGPNMGEARAGPGVVRTHRREGAERAAEVKS